jgi:hypothetical protein
MATEFRGKEYINFYLDPRDKAKLVKYCTKNELTMSECMRGVIVDFLERIKVKKDDR